MLRHEKVRKGRKGLEWRSPGLVMTAKRGMFLFMQPCLMEDLEGLVAVAVPVGDLMGLGVHLGSLLSAPSKPRRPFPWVPPGVDLIMTCMDSVQRDSENVTGPIASLKINSDKGRQHLDTEVLLDLLNSGVWDMAILPAEQAPYGDDACGTKRCRRSVQESQYFAHRIDHQHGVPLFANLQGGSCATSREHSTQDLDHDRYMGYYLGGFERHTNRSPNADLLLPSKMYASVSRTIEQLPISKPVYIGFDGTCAEIILSVMAGVDMIQIGLPSVLAKLGLQLDFKIEPEENDNVTFDSNLPETELERILLDKMDHPSICHVPLRQMADPKYRADMSRFSDMARDTGRWQCFGNAYSKAYVHHLLNVREALGHQLLEWHNWRLMIGWFKKLQSFGSERARLLTYLLWFVSTNMEGGADKNPDALSLEDMWKYELPKQYVAYDD